MVWIRDTLQQSAIFDQSLATFKHGDSCVKEGISASSKNPNALAISAGGLRNIFT